ncbi:MAG: VCBS repeat-containing protein [Planctomycetaceae bacterium]|nr:VCBS repeat-containing protein [Planctomycetaceae bacterium]
MMAPDRFEFDVCPRTTREKAAPRAIRSSSAPLSNVEHLEDRSLLSATGFDALDQGILGYDETSGQWLALRYDGESYTQDSLNDLNAVGRYADPIMIDLDADGRQEIYLRDTRSGNWYGLKPEDSSNPLQWISSWTTNSPITHTLVGDVNADGRDEIITFNSAGQWLSLSWNGTNYVTTSIQTWYPGTNWTGLQVIDLDGNGVDDLIGFDTSTGRWYGMKRANGEHTTYILADWNPSMQYGSFLVGDLNGDGREELLARDNTGSWWNLSWNGTGYQTEFMQGWDSSGNWRDFVIADLNGDGRDEIIGHQTSTGKWWGLFKESGGYVSKQLGTSDPGSTFEGMWLGDISGDGRTDVISRDNLGNFWALSSNGSASQVSFVKNWTTNTTWSDIRVIDYDGDGTAEILGRNRGNGYWWAIDKVPTGYANKLVAQWGTAGNYLYIFDGPFYAGNGIGLLGWDTYGDWWYSSLGSSTANTHVAIVTPPFHATQNSVVDLNGDGIQDLVGYDGELGNWWGLIHDYSGTHNRYLGHWDPSIAWENLLILDFDGDGRQDLAARDPVSGTWWGIYSPGKVFRSQKLTNWTPANTYQNVMVIDLEGDGKQEIVGRNSSGTWWTVVNNGTTFSSNYLQGWTESWVWKNVAVVDLEGDGKQEILGQSETRGEWWELYWTGSGYTSRKLATWDPQQTYGHLLLGDVNGDGREDAATRSSDGDWKLLSFDGTDYTSNVLFNWNTAVDWQHYSLADLDGDGKAEILAQETDTHAWWGLLANSTGYENRLLAAGGLNLLADSLSVADLNQDGKQELIGHDSTNDTWWSLGYEGNNGHVTNLGTHDWSHTTVGSVPGISNTMLRRQILFEVPELTIALGNGDTLRAAQLILDWTAKAADFALNGTDLAQDFNTVADLYYSIFKPNIKGISCGGYAAFFSGVMQLFGIDTLDIGFGELPELTHSTTVIPIFSDGIWKFYLLDPTFGVNFRHPDTNEIATWFDLIDLYLAGRTNEITRDQINLDGRDFLSQSPIITGNPNLLVLKGIQNGNYVYSYPGYDIEEYMKAFGPDLINYGYSTGFDALPELMLHRVYTVTPYGSTGSSAAAAFIAELNSRSIPFGY